ncbi:MAG: hypothetical protein DMG82_07090 [Acidobacteria bacterium]|nr:MAG: hypothetical protein DMG82_07090 [Acidobacteriota bacterium]PYX44555.1 MAG: hypothetical protein DMG83_13120 [Acidobacteriota bacterium]
MRIRAFEAWIGATHFRSGVLLGRAKFMFRRVAWLGILAFALPLAAFANEISLTNAGGVVIGNAGGLALAGSVAMNREVGATVQLTFNTGTNLFSGSAQLAGGDTFLNIMVPEPGTLSLFGTGLICVAGYIRRKRRTSHL